ncbi:MAG: HAMP domain-containing sensor histidine kinase [Proteobacteria bacterium]|nr:HAMP domain-containing sensor histidine kinase [Pseudomonadota bacterium]
MSSQGSHLKDPKRLVSAFIVGSLTVILICLSITAAIFTYSFVTRETQRVEIAHRQVLQFFQFQQTIIGEEMWTESLESIATRVAGIAAQLGDAEYDLYLADETGSCLFHSRGNLSITDCKVPKELSEFARREQNPADLKHVLRFDEKSQRNVYMTPVFVGATLKGYLYTTLTDPYHFYRGSTWSLIFEMFFPAITVILLVLIVWFFACNKLFLKPYLASLVELQREQAFVQTAQQVAHDLKSPLATLLQVTETLKQVPPERLRLIRNAVSTIRDIANSLIDKKSEATSIFAMKPAISSNEQPTVQLLSSLVDIAVAERRAEYRQRSAIEICAQPSTESYGLFAKVQPTEFKRMLSNLINNAVEAVGDEGQLAINISAEGEHVIVSISDNGIGIPAERLPLLGARGVTFGKLNGRGLGLFHAKETVRGWGGDLTIDSKEGKGTTVKVTLPRAETPSWFVSALSISESTTVVILDDDSSIHHTWANRFKSAGTNAKPVNLVKFSRADEMMRWTNSGEAPLDTLYLCDYQLNHQAKSGLDLIEQLEIQNRSILVTGHFEEREIRERCLSQGIQLIPKELIGFLPINVARNVAL